MFKMLFLFLGRVILSVLIKHWLVLMLYCNSVLSTTSVTNVNVLFI